MSFIKGEDGLWYGKLYMHAIHEHSKHVTPDQSELKKSQFRKTDTLAKMKNTLYIYIVINRVHVYIYIYIYVCIDGSSLLVESLRQETQGTHHRHTTQQHVDYAGETVGEESE